MAVQFSPQGPRSPLLFHTESSAPLHSHLCEIMGYETVDAALVQKEMLANHVLS
jgi:hypothetical protein